MVGESVATNLSRLENRRIYDDLLSFSIRS